jgi:hypothetical protein
MSLIKELASLPVAPHSLGTSDLYRLYVLNVIFEKQINTNKSQHVLLYGSVLSLYADGPEIDSCFKFKMFIG